MCVCCVHIVYVLCMRCSVRVPVRSTSRKVESLGIFPGATVVRGRDWKWGNQDGEKTLFN